MAPAHAVEIRLLGPVEAWHNDRPIALGGPRQRSLLGLLAIRPGRNVATDELIDALWAGEPPEGAATTLRSYVSRLRSAFGGDAAIVPSASGYELSVDPGSIDAVLFERRIRTADEKLRNGRPHDAASLLAEALRLWRGRPFADLADQGPLRVEADRLEELRLHALERRLELEIDFGRSADVVDELYAATAQHPFRERLWHLLMLALYHSGRQADALAAYRSARRELQDQLGVDPGPELQALEISILRHEVPLPGRQVLLDNLPLPLTEFVGRQDELVDLQKLLSRIRIVTLTGIGGVGKTRLALELARMAVDAGADGRAFIDLAAVSDAAGVTRTVASLVGVSERSNATFADQIAQVAGQGRLLFVLDNCEHVVESAAAMASTLVAAGPNVRVIATSRRPLGVQGEVEYSVVPLALPRAESTPSELLRSEAVRLLLQRAFGTLERHPDESEAVAAGRICRDLEGLPLAIELAAARAKVLSLNEIAGRLDDRFRFLVSWRRVGAGRHQTLKQAMDWSYELLEPRERSLLETASVFSGGFTLEAVAAVAEVDDALEAVTRLVDASLATAVKSAAATRYRMLETVREYGLARLRESGAERSARDRHAEYFASLAADAEPELTGPDQAEWFARLDAEHSNLLAALDHLLGAPAEPALLEFTVRLTRFWYVRGHIAEARSRLERALEATSGLDPGLRRRALTAAASMALIQGDYGAATRLAEESLEAARETGEDRLVANGLSNLGAIALAAGDVQRSGELLESAVALARTVDDSRILALAINNLADHALTVGDYSRAEPLFEESLALLRQRGDTSNVARSLFNLGAAALRQGRVDDADARFRASIAESRAAGDKEDLCWALLGVAGVAAQLDDGERAAQLVGAATALLESMGAAFKPFERALHDDTADRARELVGEDRYAEARTAGAALTLDQALEVATPD